MPSKGGLALRGGDSALRVLELMCSILILAIFSYFLACEYQPLCIPL